MVVACIRYAPFLPHSDQLVLRLPPCSPAVSPPAAPLTSISPGVCSMPQLVCAACVSPIHLQRESCSLHLLACLPACWISARVILAAWRDRQACEASATIPKRLLCERKRRRRPQGRKHTQRPPTSLTSFLGSVTVAWERLSALTPTLGNHSLAGLALPPGDT